MLLVLLAVMATVSVAAGEGAPATSELRVGYVVGAGFTPDRTNLFGRPYDSFIRAVEALGVRGRVLQVAPNQDATGPLSLLARQRYDLVIVGLPATGATVAVARRFPGTKFLVPDVARGELTRPPTRPPKNIQGTVFRAEEAGYLAGYLAALMEKRRPGRDVIGSVGGLRFPGVDRWIVGYRAGARRADPGIVLLNTYSNNFSNPTKCHAVALGRDRQGRGGPLQRGRRLRARHARRRQGEGRLGNRRRRRPVVPGTPHPDERREPARGSDPRRDGSARARHLHDGRRHRLRSGQRRRRAGKDQPRGAAASVLRQLDAVRRQIIAGRIKVPRAHPKLNGCS